MMNKTVLCTLFDGHYHYGVAALANSLAASGYEGTLWVGHREALPRWMHRHPRFDGRDTLQVTPTMALRTLALDPPMSLNYYKAQLICDILETQDLDADTVAYVDPDIVVICPWTTLSDWFAPNSVALVEDADWQLPARDPKRIGWQRYFAEYGYEPVREIDRFYNGGFVGIARSQIGFAKTWHCICQLVAAECGHVKHQRKSGAPGSLFHSTDEDALNFAITLTHSPLLAHGPEAMGFVPGGRHLQHAVGAMKPWQGRHLRRTLIEGKGPSAASAWFYRFADGPLAPFPRVKLMRRRMTLKVASVLTGLEL